MNYDKSIQRYLATRQKIADLEKELAETRAQLLAGGEYESPHYKVTIATSRREYLKSLKELQERFTPTQLKGLLGVSKISTLRVVTKK